MIDCKKYSSQFRTADQQFDALMNTFYCSFKYKWSLRKRGIPIRLLRNLKRCIYQHTNANTGCTAVFRFNPTSGAWDSAVLRCWVCTISCSNLHSGPTRGTTGVPRTPVAPATINCCYFSKMCNSQKHLKPCLCSVLNFVFNRWQEIPSLKHGSGSS